MVVERAVRAFAPRSSASSGSASTAPAPSSKLRSVQTFMVSSRDECRMAG